MAISHPSTQECENFLDHVADHLKCVNIASSPNASIEVLEKMSISDFNGYDYLVRAAILKNPNCPDDLAIKIMKNAVDITECDAVYKFWANKYSIPSRNDKLKSACKPEFPDSLISNVIQEFEETAKEFISAMSVIAEYLWFELANQKLVPLTYWDDHYHGATFGLMGWEKEFDSHIYRVLGRGFFTEWINRTGYISLGLGFDKLADDAEEVISWKDWADETLAGEPYPNSLLAYAAAYGDLMKHINLNQKHPKWQEILEDVLDGDETIWDFEITITGRPDWIGPTWAQLSVLQQSNFIANLINLINHPYLDDWGFLKHFFSLLEIHPGTHVEALAKIKETLRSAQQNTTAISESIDRNSIIEAVQVIAQSDFAKAEQLLFDAHEQADSAQVRDEATTLMLEKILLPQNRITEAQMWARSVVSKKLREDFQVRLIPLNSGTNIVRATEQNLWGDTDLQKPIQKSTNQQIHYNRVLKYLTSVDKSVIPRETISTWPGPGFSGLINGLWDDSGLAEFGCERETAAIAAFDFLNFISPEALGSKERAPGMADAPYLNYSDEELIRLCALEDPWALKEYGLRLDRNGKRKEAIAHWEKAAQMGNHPAMRNLGVITMQNKDPKTAADFFQQAISLGSRTSYHALADAYEYFEPDLVEPTLLAGVEHGDVVAMNNLGVRMQRQERYSEAAYFYRRAAEYEDEVAAANLASMLLIEGKNDESLIWLERAEDNPSQEVLKVIENVRYRIKSNQIESFNDDSDDWDEDVFDDEDEND